MKLHLPSLLRRALLTCMAAVSGVAVSVGTGSMTVGSATLLISSASVVKAALAGPYDNEGNPLEYSDVAYEVDPDDLAEGRNWMHFDSSQNVNLTVDFKNYDASQAKFGLFGVQSDAGSNLKITLTGANASSYYSLTSDSSVHSTSLWLTGSKDADGNFVGKNALQVGQDVLSSDIQDIYIEQVALQFVGSYQGQKELGANLILGASSYANGQGRPAMDGSTLVVGTWENSNVINVTTTGDLIVREDAKVGFFTPGSSLVIKGAISGSGTLSLASISNGPGNLYLMGGSDKFTGALNLNSNATRVYFGQDIELGGLTGAANNVYFGLSDVGSITLTLNVTRDMAFTGVSNTATVTDLWDRNIFLVKKGVGKQVLSSFSGAGVSIEEQGELDLTNRVWLGTRGVTVAKGGVLRVGSSGYTADFAGGQVSVSNGSLILAGTVSMRDADLILLDEAYVSYTSDSDSDSISLGNITLGGERSGSPILGAVLSLNGKVRLNNADLNLISGTLELGGSVSGISRIIEVGSDVTLRFLAGTELDVSGLGAGVITANVDTNTFGYTVDVLHVADGGIVEGWRGENSVRLTGGFDALEEDNGIYRAGVSWSNTVIVQDLQTISVNWLNGHQVEGVQTWVDSNNNSDLTKTSIAVIVPGSVTFVTGRDIKLNSDPLPEGDNGSRIVENIFVAENTTLRLRQYRNSIYGAYGGNVRWHKMLLMGDLVLQDRDVIARDNYYNDEIAWGPGAHIVVDWCFDGVTNMGTYGAPGRRIGNSSNLPGNADNPYTGTLVVQSGVFELQNIDRFDDVIVKDGAQATIRTSDYTGNVTISGKGVHTTTGEEVNKSALKLGSNRRLKGNLTIADEATVHVWRGESAWIEGQLLGSGLGEFSFVQVNNTVGDHENSHLYVLGEVKGIKLFNIEQDANLYIVSDFDSSNIDEAAVASRRFEHLSGGGNLHFQGSLTGFDRFTVGASSHLVVTDVAGKNTFGADIRDFVKDGAGTMDIFRNFETTGKLTINGGTLRFGNPANAADSITYRFYASDVEVMNSCTFVLTHNYENFGTNVTLSDGTFVNGGGWTSADSYNKYFKFGVLTVTGGSSILSWATPTNVNEGFAFDLLTGNGDLQVGAMNNAVNNSQIFRVDEIVNYSGSLTSSISTFNNSLENKKFIIGTVHQDSGQNGAISLTNGHVSSSGFRKTGAGEFTINSIAFDTEVWMNYEGTLKLDSVKFWDNTILHYTTGDNERVILSSDIENDDDISRLYIDILDLSNEDLASGINLGFYANVSDASKIRSKLVVGGMSEDDYELYTQNGRLYLRSSVGVNMDWDRAMGVISLAWAPTRSVLSQHLFGSTITGTQWTLDAQGNVGTGALLELGSKSNYAVQKSGQLTTVVQLTNQSGGDYATVMGGKSATGMLYTQSYIYMTGGHYYMLIGGGANLTTDGSGSGGVSGGSHIQIESGSVDYIVGGNHLSSGGYVFDGESYVSFQGGTLRGGIVGGNTYAGSGGTFGRATKHGSSNIFIYTALANADETAPTIGVLETYKNTAAPFTKVVGGSAYVSYGATSAPIAFYGDSRIIVNLSSYTGEDSFDKDIIGGNAYLSNEFDAENKLAYPAPDAWSSTFEGDSSITITGTRKDGKSVLFSGNVAGASEHNVRGSQQIAFTGDATVSIHGGEFLQAVAGGFYIGSESEGSHIATFTGDSAVALNGGSFWRVVGGSYSLGTGEGASYLMHKGNTSLEISSGTFTAEVPKDAAEVDPETWRSFVAGGSYLTANRNDASPLVEAEGGATYPHVHDGEAKLLITGGSFHSTLLVGGDFLSASPAADYANSVYPVSHTIRGTYADISGATITDALVVGGSYLADTTEFGGVEIDGGSFLSIGEGARIEASDAADQYGIAAAAGSYLNVAGDNHHATIENGSTLTMTGGSVTGHLVGGSVMTGYANSLETDSITVLLSGGSVQGSVYGGHYVGKVAVTSAVSATTMVTEDIDVTLDGAAVTGNIFGGGSFSCGEGYGSESYIQQQADIVVRLVSGSLTGNVYAAGELGRPADILQEGEDPITPDGARVMTDSTRVELSSSFAFGSSKSVVSGDYLEADARYHAYQGEISGDRTLAFTDDGNFASIKNWNGVSFIHFDAIEVADNATVVLSKTQFTGEESGFYKTGGGTLELGGAMPGNAPLYVMGGTLRLTEKQKLGGGLHFDLTGRMINDASTALLQGLGGFEKGIVDVYLEGDLDSIGYGTYYLVSGWNADEMHFVERFGMTDVREFVLKEDKDSNCLILNVRERSNDKWLWRGDTSHPIVGAYEWDSKYAANWNAHEMAPATTETPEGKNVRFTASVGGEVKVGELVHPASVTVESGNYVFTQRSDADSPVIEGIWTDRLSVGGAYQEAVLDLQLANRNINNIFLENNGTLILSHARAIVSSIDRPTENSIIYFNGGTLIYGEEFDKDISWQVNSESSIGIVRVGIAGNHVEDNRIVWGKLYDSEATETWSYNGALNIALQRGIEKSGEGTLRMQWGDANPNAFINGVEYYAYTGTVDVKEGVLECLISVPMGSANLRKFSNTISVAADAEFVVSVARTVRVSLEDSLAGEGTVVLGRQLDEPNVFWAYGTISCGAQYHGGLLTDNMPGAYVIGADNRDFAGTIVLEGGSTRNNSDYVTIGRRMPGEEENLIGYDSDSQTLTALGGGQTTLVLAGRHITIDGLVHANAHNNPNPYEIDSNLVPFGNWASGGREKYIRAGIVEVREGTFTYIGSTTRDDETDNTRIHATAYRPWDDNVIITGKLTGSGTLATPWGYHSNSGGGDGQGHAWYGGYYDHTLQGAVSEFTGTIVAGDIQSWRDTGYDIDYSSSSWTFFAASATDVPGERSIVNAQLAGAGTMYFMYTQDTVLAGVIGDLRMDGFGNSLRLTNSGTGTIIIGNNHNTATGLLYLNNGDFALGDEKHYANWVGKYIRGDSDRSFILVNGELSAPMERIEGSEVRFRVVTSDLGATKVNAGGTQGSDLFEVTINKGGFLSGVYGDIVASRDGSSVKLVFGKSNITSSANAEADHMIELRFNTKLSIEDANYFLMDFSVDSIVELLREMGSAPQSAAYLHVLSRGELDIHKSLWSEILADGGSGARLLAQLGLYINDVSGGDIIMGSVGGHRAYQVFSDPSNSDPHTVEQYDVLSGYDAVILEQGQTLDVTLTGTPAYGTRDYQAGGAVVPNLWGDRNTLVRVRNGNYNRGNISIIFYNATGDGVGSDSEFYGTIDGGEHVDFVKDGAGQLTIGYHDRAATTGGFSGETLNIRQGAVIMQGESNKIGKLTFSYHGDELAEGEKRGLTLLNGKTTIDSVVEAGDHAGPIILGNNAEFNLILDSRDSEEVDKDGEEDYKTNHVNVWNDLVVMRQSAQSTGSFIVTGGELYMTNAKEAQLQGVHLGLEKNALLSLSCLEGASIASLNGNGTLMAEAAGTLEVTNEGNGLFTGTLGSSHVGENTLHISNNMGTLTLRTVKNDGMWSVHNDGKLAIDVSGKYSRAANNNIKLNHLILGDDSQTTYTINSDHCIDDSLSEMLTANSLTVGNRASLTIESEGNLFYAGDHLIIANVGAGSSTDGLLIELVGFSFFLNEVKHVRVDMNGNLRLELNEVTDNPLTHPNMEGNALSGAQLLYEAGSSNSRIHSLSIEEYQDLRDLISGMTYLKKDAEKDGDYSAMDKALAASAGASTAILGPAMVQDMQRQLQAIRNRTTTMGANPNYASGDGPVWHAWINAEGNYHQQDADSLAPGFKLNSWGGTIGMDVDMSARSTFGLALTAMYGSLDANGPDKGDGKMDTYYLSFFGKTSRGRWMHTFVGSIGLASVSLDRTVNYAYGSYTTSGSTNGYAFGLMYEVGYSVPLNDEASYAIQPVANVTLRHVGLSGYEENGHGAQLRVGDISQTILTLGAGVRAQAVVGENMYNRTSILEGRLLVKLDSGDTKGSSTTSLVNGSPLSVPVEAAEVGSVGVEVGVGITIPMDNSSGSVFFDASAEIRAGYTNMNATVGYRVDF